MATINRSFPVYFFMFLVSVVECAEISSLNGQHLRVIAAEVRKISCVNLYKFNIN